MIEDLVRQAGPGIWTDRIDALKDLTARSQFLRTDRDWLEQQLTKTMDRRNKGRLCNLSLLALLIDRTRFEKWLRRSGVLRASRYGLDPSIPMFVCQALLKNASSIDLTAETKAYLENTQRFLQIAPAVRKLNALIVKELFADKNAVKGLLITLDLLFLIRSELNKPDFDGFIPESLAEGFSYLLFLYAQRVGSRKADLGAIDASHIREDFYFDLIQNATRIRTHAAWEILLDYFNYRCLIDEDGAFRISAPDEVFQKAMRWGYINTFMQTHNLLTRTDQRKLPSLRDVGKALHDQMKAADLIELKSDPRRWRFSFPAAESLQKLLKSGGYFREEFSVIAQLAKEFFTSVETLEQFQIEGINVATLFHCQRLINLLRFAIAPFLAQHIRTDASTVAQSLIPVFARESLLELLEYGSSRKDAEVLLDLLTWNPKKAQMFDAMYQPFIEMSPGQYMVPLNILGSADLIRNLMMLTGQRLNSGKNDPLGELFKNVLLKATDKAECDVKYKFGTEAGEIDTVAMIGNVMFVFECKNSLLPCSVFELRTSWDHLLHAKHQLDRFNQFWLSSEFRQLLANKLGWNLDGVSEVVTCIVTGNRMFSGIRLGQHPVRPFYEIGNFIIGGELIIFDQELRLRPEGPLAGAALRDFISSDELQKKRFAALRCDDRIVRFGETTVSIEDYVLDPLLLGAEFGVVVPEHVKSSLAARP